MANNPFEEDKKELDALNLKTREDLKALVKSLIKEATKIIVKEPSVIPKDSHVQSHFGGQPYFEQGETWHTNKKGDPLEFVFQIFNNDHLALPKNIKLIQFYYDFEEFAYQTDHDGWLVKIYENLHTENSKTIEKPKDHHTVQFCEIVYESIQSLPDLNGIEGEVYANALKLSCVLDEDDSFRSYLEIVEELIGGREPGSQLSGYPSWIQAYENYHNLPLLFQIDSEDNAGLRWGDCGMVYVFYDAETKKTEFTWQCF